MPKKTYKILRFDGGINNDADPRDIGDNQFAELQNVAVDEMGKIVVLGDIQTEHVALSGAITAQGTGLKAVKTDYDGLITGSADAPGQAYWLVEDGAAIRGIGDDGETTTISVSSLAEANMYYIDGALRIYDGDHTTGAIPQWRGYIPGVLYGTADADGDRYKGQIWNSGASKADSWYTKGAQIAGCFPEEAILGTDSHTGAQTVGVNLIMGSSHCTKNYTANLDGTYTGGNSANDGRPADLFAFANETCATGAGPGAVGGDGTAAPAIDSGMYWGFGLKFLERANDTGTWMPTGTESYQFWCTTVYDGIQESLPQLFTMYPAGFQAAVQGGGVNNQNFGPVVAAGSTCSYISAKPETSLHFGESGDPDTKGNNVSIHFNPVIKMCDAQWDNTTDFTGSGDSLAISDVHYNFGAVDGDGNPDASGTGAGSGNPRITALRVYWSSNEDGFGDKWLLLEYNLAKGVMSYGSTAGGGGSYSRNDWTSHGPTFTGSGTGTDYWYQHTHGDVGGGSGVEFKDPPRYFRYDALNGHGSDDIVVVDSFKASVVANGAVYLGNVQVDGKVYSDRMIRSGYHLDGPTPDKFPMNANNIDVATHDGDEIIALLEYADRILQFKRNTCYIINVSGATEYLEAEYKFKGITNPGAACRTDYGIAWVNQNGCYWYNGEQVTDLLEADGIRKIKQSAWSTFIGTSNYHRIGFNPFKRQLIVLMGNSDNDAYVYDMTIKSWTYSSYMVASGTTKSNFINDPIDGTLLIHDGSGSIDKWADTPVGDTTPPIVIATKDIDFGEPGVRKQLYKVHVTHKGTGTRPSVNYFTNGGTTEYDFTGTLLSSSVWTKSELVPDDKSEAKNIYSCQLKFTGTAATDFEINDITFIYRTKKIK